MIQFLYDTTVTGDRFPAGSISNFGAVIEGQLISQGAAILCPLPVLIRQGYASIPRSSTNTSADASYQILASVIIPAGSMGPNSAIWIMPDWDYPNSASTKTMAVDFGGTNIAALPQTTGNVGSDWLIRVKNANSLNAQKVANNINYGLSATNARKTPAIDTTQDVAIDFKCQWGAGVSGETITLSGYSVWHYPGS